MKTEEIKSGFMKWQIRFICKHAVWILAAFLLATAALLPTVSKLKLHANFLDLLPPSHPSVINLKELIGHVGGTSFLIAVIESPDEETARLAAERFSRKASSLSGVDYVDNRTDVPALQNRKLLFLKADSLQILKKDIEDTIGYYRRKANPFFVDLLEEKAPVIDLGKLELDQKVFKIGGFASKERDSYMNVVLLKPKHAVGDFSHSKQLFDEAKALFNEIKKDFRQPVTIGFTGSYRTRYEEYNTITHDLKLTGIVATVLLVMVNLVGFRNFRSLLYAYLPLALGTIWIWAFTEVTIGYLNLITAFLAAILFGMGGDYTFHILVSFEEDLEITGGDVGKALEMTFTDLWHPLWSSMWTTAVVFYAMMLSQFEGFRHFGIIAGVGIVISFVIVLWIQPCLIVLVEKYFPLHRRQSPQRQLSKKVVYAVIAAGMLLSLVSVFHLQHVKFNYDFSDLQAKNEEGMKFAEKVGKHFGVHLNPVVFMAPNRERATQLAGQINTYIETHPETLFDFAAALTSHVPSQQEEKIRILGEIDELLKKHDPSIQKLEGNVKDKIENLKKQLHPEPFGLAEMPKGLEGQYEGKDHKISIVFVYPRVRILNGENAKKFIAEARRFPAGEDIKLAGETLIYADILGLIERDAPVAIGLSTVVVFLLVLWHFKRLDHTLWVHAPLAIGGFWMLGMMGLFGLKFNFFNMVIIPSILGVGIDNGIYIFDRYKERKNENFFECMGKSIKGVMLSSATNISAFASLMFASHQGMASMGAVGFYGFLACLLSSVFFIPALIEFFEFKYSHLFRRGSDKV